MPKIICRSEYAPRTHDDFIQTEEIPNQGGLYSVSQRVPAVTNSYSSLCPDGTYAPEQSTYATDPEWERERTVSTTSDTNKDVSSDTSDKPTNGECFCFSICCGVNIRTTRFFFVLLLK